MLSTAETLTDLCPVLRNWFDRQRWYGAFSVRNGAVSLVPASASGPETVLRPGQFYRVIGSMFYDGVHRFPEPLTTQDAETEEDFEGAVWAMAVPVEVQRLANTIANWRDKYEAAALSPFTQETVPGLYSYMKGGFNANSGTPVTWQQVFSRDINRWRKL